MNHALLPHPAPFAGDLHLCGCPLCHLVSEVPDAKNQNSVCPRCHSRLRSPSPNSVSTSAAWLIAAMIFYIPANLLPVIATRGVINGGESTIVAGVIDFWRSGAYGIALLIFTASMVIPGMKFIAMALLLFTTWRNSPWARQERTRLYRLMTWIGHWSMLDVVVVAGVCQLVQFHTLNQAEPRDGILFFGLVVILTMLSVRCFDPRLIWREVP